MHQYSNSYAYFRQLANGKHVIYKHKLVCCKSSAIPVPVRELKTMTFKVFAAYLVNHNYPVLSSNEVDLLRYST